jgi:hypothetical protein
VGSHIVRIVDEPPVIGRAIRPPIGKLDVDAVVVRVHLLGDHHRERGRNALALVLTRQLEAHAVVGGDFEREVVLVRLLDRDQRVAEVDDVGRVPRAGQCRCLVAGQEHAADHQRGSADQDLQELAPRGLEPVVESPRHTRLL